MVVPPHGNREHVVDVRTGEERVLRDVQSVVPDELVVQAGM
jgi:hypothetical protein